jgi:hypothetical protein
VVRLDGQHDAPVGARHVLRAHRPQPLREGLDRPFDRQAVAVDRIDMLLHDVDQQHVLAGACPVGAQRAADRAGTPDQDGVLVGHRSARVTRS